MLGITLFAMMQWQPNAEACADMGNLPQQPMNACAHWDYQQADGELNAVYEQVIEYARGYLSYQPEGEAARPSGEERIRRAQRAWVTLRDEHCEAWSYHMIGGTMEPFLFHSCRARLTRERTEELRRLMIEDR